MFISQIQSLRACVVAGGEGAQGAAGCEGIITQCTNKEVGATDGGALEGVLHLT